MRWQILCVVVLLFAIVAVAQEPEPRSHPEVVDPAPFAIAASRGMVLEGNPIWKEELLWRSNHGDRLEIAVHRFRIDVWPDESRAIKYVYRCDGGRLAMVEKIEGRWVEIQNVKEKALVNGKTVYVLTTIPGHALWPGDPGFGDDADGGDGSENP